MCVCVFTGLNLRILCKYGMEIRRLPLRRKKMAGRYSKNENFDFLMEGREGQMEGWKPMKLVRMNPNETSKYGTTRRRDETC